METQCNNCHRLVSMDAAFCAYCGTAFAEDLPPAGGPGWYPHGVLFWQQRHWDGAHWGGCVEQTPEFVAAGMIGAVFIFPTGVIWGGAAPVRKARKYGGLTPLIDAGDLSAVSYNLIQRIHYSEPSMVSNGNFSLVIPQNSNEAKWKRFAGSVVFEKRHRIAFRTAYGMIDARCRQAGGDVSRLPLPPVSAPPGAPGSSVPGSAAQAGWYPDPAGRHALRHFDGTDWSDYASDSGDRIVDPL